MQRKPNLFHHWAGWALLVSVMVVITTLAACSSAPSSSPTLDSTAIFENALLTATYSIIIPTQTLTPIPTLPPTTTFTPQPTLTPTETPWSGPPPELPSIFQSDYTSLGVTPNTYIPDTCQYLKDRWNPNNSQPGTVVMAIMYHSITEDFNPLAADGTQIHHSDLVTTLEHAHELGFQTVTTEQLVNFLEQNAKIPPRSMILIVDDRRPGVVREHFWPFLEKYHWTLTLSWLIGDTDQKPASPLNCCPEENFTSLWDQMETYNASGYLDIQAHGYIHNIPIDDYSTEDFLQHEIVDSRQVLQDHFYCKDHTTGLPIENCQTNQPLAFIWPGGGFSKRAAEVAREAGYHIGFTINPRGPIMYNWIPLASEVNPNSPSWLPEASVGDPMMVLPRYWSSDAAYRLDDVANIGEEAANSAAQSRQAELDYYHYYCRDVTGEIPTVVP
jgi:hypothetical protein